MMEKFINKLFTKLRFIHWFKTLHERLKQVNIYELKDDPFKNPYMALLDWLMYVLQFGTLNAFVIIILITGWQGILRTILLILATGIIWWLWLKLLEQTKETLSK